MSGCVQLWYNLNENISYWTTLIQCSSSVFNHHTRPEGGRGFVRPQRTPPLDPPLITKNTIEYRPRLIYALSLGDYCVGTSQYTAASCIVPTHTRWRRSVDTCCGQGAWPHTDDELHEAATSQHSAMCHRRVSTRNPNNMAQAGAVVVVVILGYQLLQIYIFIFISPKRSKQRTAITELN